MRTHRVGRILTPTAALVALALALVLLGLALTGPANASTSRLAVESKDTIVQFGNDVIVTRNESVGTIVAFGGDVTVAGEVRQTIVAFGGDVSLKSTAVVGSDMSRGDTAIVAFGGKVTKSPDAAVTGTIETRRWLGLEGSPGHLERRRLRQVVRLLVLRLARADRHLSGARARGRGPHAEADAGGAASPRRQARGLARLGRAHVLRRRPGRHRHTRDQHRRHPARDPRARRRSAGVLLRYHGRCRVHRAEGAVGGRSPAEPDAGSDPGRDRYDHRLPYPGGRPTRANRDDRLRHGRRRPGDRRVAARSQDLAGARSRGPRARPARLRPPRT